MPRAKTRGRIRRHQRHATAAVATGSNSVRKNSISTPLKQAFSAIGISSSGGGKDNNIKGCSKNYWANKNDNTRRAGGYDYDTDGEDVMMAIDEEFRDDDDSSTILLENNTRKGVQVFLTKKKRRLVELSTLATMAARPFALMKSRPTGVVSYNLSATASGDAACSAAQRLEAFQDWFVVKTKSKEWRRVNSAMLLVGDDAVACLPGDSVTVFSFHQQQGSMLGGNSIVVGAIILSRKQQNKQQQQRNHHRTCYYDKSCRVFMEIDEHTGNVMRQWTNLSTHSTTDVLLYRNMLEQLVCQTHEQTVVFRDSSALERANATGKLPYGDSALCLLEENNSACSIAPRER